MVCMYSQIPKPPLFGPIFDLTQERYSEMEMLPF
jgi:hypothetical protein